jgi:hypothetical protein
MAGSSPAMTIWIHPRALREERGEVSQPLDEALPTA